MNSLLLCLLCLETISALSFGDFAEPTNASIFNDTRIRVVVSINQATSVATFFAKFNSYGYFSLLFSTGMANGDFHNFEIGPSAINIMDYYSSGGHNTPTRDGTDNLVVLGYDTDGSSYVTVKYTRALSTGDTAGRDVTLVFGQSYSWVYAFRAGSMTMAKHHAGEYVYMAALKLDNNSTVAGGNGTNPTGEPLSDSELIHGIILSVLWIVVADLAIFLKYVYSFKWRIFWHAFLLTVVLLGTVVLLAIIIAEKQPKVETLPTTKGAHYVMGLMVLGWVILQCVVGAAMRLMQSYDRTSPAKIMICRKLHLYSGYVLLLLGKVNVMIGWAMKGNIVGLSVSLPIATLSFGLIVICVYKSSESIAVVALNPNNNWLRTQESERRRGLMLEKQFMAVIDVPYCFDKVQQMSLFIFNDLIYESPKEDFHPGGKKVIREIMGREVDRFIYGSMFTEEDPDLKGFEHPAQSMDVVGKPIAKLPPNPSCQLLARVFSLHTTRRIDKELSVFYFEPLEGTVQYHIPKDLRHIGQYFTVYAFGYTRLYTCMFCMRKEKIQERQRVLEAVMPEEQTRLLQIHHLERSRRNEEIAEGRDKQQAKKIGNERKTTTNRNSSEVQLRTTSVPLIIKRYPEPETRFTNQLYTTRNHEGYIIEGPKGRGMCLEKVPDGNVVVVAGGTGLFPFLDLVDELFKLTVHTANPQAFTMNEQELAIVNNALASKSFHFLISVNTVKDLIMPDEMRYMNEHKFNANFHVRIGRSDPTAHEFDKFKIDRFSRDMLYDKINPLLDNLSIVYICGPQRLYKEVAGYLSDLKVPTNKMFYL